MVGSIVLMMILAIVIVMRHRKIETVIKDKKTESIHESKRIGKRISAKGRKGVDMAIMANTASNDGGVHRSNDDPSDSYSDEASEDRDRDRGRKGK